ncbi:hypothetical protein [Blastococcus deserti]|uniref:Mce-associated membrane protein n=1 Tax=Blastococcus deserti TaxID=2259033 RepID=A0ABW4X709_9ACTN
MSRRIGALVVVLVLIGLGIGYAFWSMRSDDPGTIATSTTTPAGSSDASAEADKAAFASQDAARLEKALNSGDQGEQLSALSANLRAVAEEQNFQLIPPGQQIRLLSDTFRSTGDAATVESEMSDGRRFLLLMMREADHWQIVTTEEAS